MVVKGTREYEYEHLEDVDDDTTLAECVEKNGTSSMQSRVDEFVTKSLADGFQLNESKCKEVRESFRAYYYQ